jgi:DNA primase
MSLQKTSRKTLDLNKVRQIIFDDIDVLLDSFGLEYEQVADNIFMKCPIHEGSDNPQGLSISTTRQAWRCWTRGCHEHYNTDIFGFVKGVLDTDSFSEALSYICKLYDVDNAKTESNKPKTTKKSDVFGDLVKAVSNKKDVTSIQPVFEKVPTSKGSPYFESRGFSAATLKHFGVRDCCDRSSPMRFRSIIPIHFCGSQVGYIARSTRDWLQPKYLFSNGIRKTDYLYNYDEAISSCQETKSLFLVEGQGDVWKLWECGVKNVVGLFGKDISSEQRKLLLKTGVTTLIVLTDNDQAGRESKIKIKRDMSRLFTLVFPKMSSKDLGNMNIDTIRDSILKNLRGYLK